MNCNGHGICVGGTCVCVSGYQGKTCSDVVATSGNAPPTTQAADSACPAGCSGHGVCLADGSCACDPGFAGEDCSSDTTQGIGHRFVSFLETEATNTLQPVVHSHNMKQAPILPYHAESTSFISSSSTASQSSDGTRLYAQGDDRSQCNNHGSYRNSQCFCDPGFSGSTCNEAIACLNHCSERGTCSMGLCFCEPGFTGSDCSVSLSCPNDCSGNGLCWHGRCSCDAGYEGVDCSDSKPRSELTGLTITELIVVCAIMFGIGGFLGLTIKAQLDQRKKAIFNKMLEQEVNTQFAA